MFSKSKTKTPHEVLRGVFLFDTLDIRNSLMYITLGLSLNTGKPFMTELEKIEKFKNDFFETDKGEYITPKSLVIFPNEKGEWKVAELTEQIFVKILKPKFLSHTALLYGDFVHVCPASIIAIHPLYQQVTMLYAKYEGQFIMIPVVSYSGVNSSIKPMTILNHKELKMRNNK